METEIIDRGGTAVAKVKLLPHETFQAEAGSLIAMSQHVSVTTSSQLKRPQSLFINSYSAGEQTAEIYLGQAFPGEMCVQWLEDEGMIIGAGSFVGADQAVALELNWSGFRAVLENQEFLWLHAGGVGEIILGAFGALQEINLQERLTVNAAHLVAFEDKLIFTVRKNQGLLLCEFEGQGRIWCQSHDRGMMGRALTPFLRRRD